MKPRDKVVTAEDIQSSLYYVHVGQPDDARLLTPPHDAAFADSLSPPPSQSPLHHMQRKAVPTTLAPPSMAAAPQRKPVPGTLTPVDDFNNRQNIGALDYARRPREHSDSNQHLSVDSNRYQEENDVPPSLPPRKLSEQPATGMTTLTLIRRDPSSSAQWNVASIEDPPVLDISSTTLNDPVVKKRTGAPMYIEISNPGYSKFLHALDNRSASAHFGNGQTHGETVFCRRLWMEGSRYSNSNFGHRKNSSYDLSSGRQNPRNSLEGLRGDRMSADLRSSDSPPFLVRDDQPYNPIASDKQSSFRGYVFNSPWNGRCEFITGPGGGSLRCVDHLP